MEEFPIFERERPFLENFEFYRNSPFEYDDTSLGGQRVLRIGNFFLTNRTQIVGNPLSITVRNRSDIAEQSST